MYRYGKTSIKSLSFSLTVINYFCLGGDIIKTEKKSTTRTEKKNNEWERLTDVESDKFRSIPSEADFSFWSELSIAYWKKYFRNLTSRTVVTK